MQLLNQLVKDAFQRALLAAFPSLVNQVPVIAASKFGDYQCNNALLLFKQHGKELGLASGKEAAERIAEHLLAQTNNSLFSNVKTSPQGFVTVDLSPTWLQSNLSMLMQQRHLLPPLPEEQKSRVLVDFSSPNVAKEMHVGHLRSTIIGESICRILEYRGHDVERVNHIGDWGTQFGMLIEYLLSNYPGYKDNLPDLSDLNTFYKQSKAAFDADEDFKRRSRERVVKLQAGDKEALEAWELICDISRKEFQKVYRRLGVRLEERGESFYNSAIPKVIEELSLKGMVKESEGARCVFTSAGDVPLMLVKSDGGYGYDSTDIAAIRDRLIERRCDWLIYVTDSGQESHFLKIFAAAEAAGWHRPPRTRVDHMGFGVVQGLDGKRFKTRSGEVVKLVDLLDEAKARALKELERRKAEEAAAAAAASVEAQDAGDDAQLQLQEGLAVANACNGGGRRSDSICRTQQLSKREEAAVVSADAESPPCGCLRKMLESEIIDPDMKRAAEAIGYSAVKYFDLKQNRQTDYKFSYDRMLDPKGNTAVYMMYAYARICAIFRKAGVDPTSLNARDLDIVQPTELKLGVLLAQFPDVVTAILEDLHIHRLAEYMYKVAGAFTEFYQSCKVVGVPQQSSRLSLCECTRKILYTCFELLGITPLERL